jgi:hypothetical protein
MAIRGLFAAAVLAGAMFFAQHALAFTVEEKSGSNPDGSPRYVDPDDQPLPFPFLRLGTPTQGSEYQGGDSQYAPNSDRSDQWLRLPDWTVSSPPPRR